MVQRHAKHLFDLAGFWHHGEIARHIADHGGDAKAGDRLMGRKNTQDIYDVARQADLFARFAQGGGDDIRIAAVLFTPRKGNLPGVMLQRR